MVDYSNSKTSLSERFNSDGRILLSGQIDQSLSFYAVPFDYILTRGYIAFSSAPEEYHTKIDWSSDDAFISAIHDIRDSIIYGIQSGSSNNHNIQSLVDLKSSPSFNRIDWERNLSEAVSRAVNDVKGLDHYIRSSEAPMGDSYVLNNIGKMIEQDGSAIQYAVDCKVMAAVEGSIIQSVENAVLGDGAGRYFYVPGKADGNPHTYIASEKTGNIIESTIHAGQIQNATIVKRVDDGGTNYFVGSAPNHSFQNFIDYKTTQFHAPDTRTSFVYIAGFGDYNVSRGDDLRVDNDTSLDQQAEDTDISAVKQVLNRIRGHRHSEQIMNTINEMQEYLAQDGNISEKELDYTIRLLEQNGDDFPLLKDYFEAVKHDMYGDGDPQTFASEPNNNYADFKPAPLLPLNFNS